MSKKERHILVIPPAMQEYATRFGAAKLTRVTYNIPLCVQCNIPMQSKRIAERASWYCGMCSSTEGYYGLFFFDGKLPNELVGFRKKQPVQVRDQSENPQCPKCGGQMCLRKRKADKHSFWGCMSWPRCNGIVQDDPIDLPHGFRQTSSKSQTTNEHQKKETLFALMLIASRIFGSVDKASLWFSTPKYTLDNKTPLESLDSKYGIKAVQELLQNLER